MLRAFSRKVVGRPDEPAARYERAEPRIAASITATIDWAGRDCPCLMVDLAQGGARIRLSGVHRDRYPCLGEQVVVTPDSGEPLTGILRWHDGDHLGIRFPTALDVEYVDTLLKTSTLARPLQHRPTRIKLGRSASVSLGASHHRVSLVNISSGGALIDCPQPIPIGTALFLHFGDLRPIGAYVRRHSAREIGLLFSRLLSIDAARHIAQLCDVDPRWVDEVTEHHSVTGAAKAL